MARKRKRPQATREEIIECVQRACPNCGSTMWIDYENYRTITTLDEVVRLRLKVRRCQNRNCDRYHKAYRPEGEGQWALPEHEFGLDVIAQIGALRYQQHRTVSEIHTNLIGRGMTISERTVTNLLDRYDELVAIHLSENERLRTLLQEQGRVILALDGMQPDVGHEVLWLIRDCLSGEVLLARSLLSAEGEALASLLLEVKGHLSVPIVGVVSDGQRSIRKGVELALPDVPHGLCHFHYLREAVRPLYEADRHAKKELKKRVRGVRAIERKVEASEEPMDQAIQDYCSAVRSALTQDGRPPLDASGLRLEERLTDIADSLDRIEEKGGSPSNSDG